MTAGAALLALHRMLTQLKGHMPACANVALVLGERLLASTHCQNWLRQTSERTGSLPFMKGGLLIIAGNPVGQRKGNCHLKTLDLFPRQLTWGGCPRAELGGIRNLHGDL